MEIIHGFFLPLMITRVSRALVGASCSFYASFFRSVVIYNSPANTRQSLRTFRWHSVVSCAHSGTGSFCQPDFVLWTRAGLWSPWLQGSSLQVKEEAVCWHCFQLQTVSYFLFLIFLFFIFVLYFIEYIWSFFSHSILVLLGVKKPGIPCHLIKVSGIGFFFEVMHSRSNSWGGTPKE